MSQVITIFDKASPALQKFVARLTPRSLGEIVWPPCLELTRRRLIAYKNRKGFPSQGFGEQLASKTFGAATNTGAKIVINAQGANQLYYGGPIPKRGPYTGPKGSILTIPIDAESYGKSVEEMFGGKIPPRKQRTPADRAKLAEIRKHFIFTPTATTKPHPDLLPSKADYAATGKKAISDAVKGGFK